jgi:hypothetical protein
MRGRKPPVAARVSRTPPVSPQPVIQRSSASSGRAAAAPARRAGCHDLRVRAGRRPAARRGGAGSPGWRPAGSAPAHRNRAGGPVVPGGRGHRGRVRRLVLRSRTPGCGTVRAVQRPSPYRVADRRRGDRYRHRHRHAACRCAQRAGRGNSRPHPTHRAASSYPATRALPTAAANPAGRTRPTARRCWQQRTKNVVDGLGNVGTARRFTRPRSWHTCERLHFDIHVSGSRSDPLATRMLRVDAEARRLTDLGATLTGALSTDGLDHYAMGMKDPEGNEFDIN